MLSGVAPQNCKTYASRCSKLWDSVDSADMYFPAHKQTPKNMIPFNESHIWISPKNDDVILSVSPSIPFPPPKKNISTLPEWLPNAWWWFHQRWLGPGDTSQLAIEVKFILFFTNFPHFLSKKKWFWYDSPTS